MDNGNQLPEDVVVDILSWLPAKSLFRFRSVSKHWHSLIRSPNFISLHRTRAQIGFCVSLLRPVDDDPYHLSMHFLPDQASIHDLDFSFTRPYLAKGFCHQGYCNGLMCLSANYNVVICNPATRECRLIPRPPHPRWHTRYLGFAFDSKTDDYKVVRVATLGENLSQGSKFQIYGMSADSWEELIVRSPDHYFPGVHHHPCTSLDGVFYWLRSNGYEDCTLDALNTVEGTFGRRSLPVGVHPGSRTNLCLLNNSLALVVAMYDAQLKETQIDVWLMDEYGVPDCWTKKYIIGSMFGNWRPFGFLPNSEVLMIGCDDGLIMSYNHRTGDIKEYKQLRSLPKLRCLSQVFQYSESFASVRRQVDLA